MIMCVILLMASAFYTVDAADKKKDFDVNEIYTIADQHLRPLCETTFTLDDIEALDNPALGCIACVGELHDKLISYQKKAEQYRNTYSGEVSKETEQQLEEYFSSYSQAIEHYKKGEAARIDCHTQIRIIREVNDEVKKSISFFETNNPSDFDADARTKLLQRKLAECEKARDIVAKQEILDQKVEFPEMPKEIEHIFQ